MLDQQTFQRPGLNDPLKCSPLSNENIIRENNSDDNSSTAEQIATDIYDSQQFWNSSLDDVNQVLQSLTISTNADAASNQSSSSAYSSSYSSPTSTSYGPGLGAGLPNNPISQLNNIPNQSRLNEWVSNPAVNASSWAAQNLSSPTINPPSLSRPLFNNGPTAPMAAFGNPNGWGQNLAAQLAVNNNLQTYLMRNAFKNMPSPGRRSNSGFGGRDSSIIPSKVRLYKQISLNLLLEICRLFRNYLLG